MARYEAISIETYEKLAAHCQTFTGGKVTSYKNSWIEKGWFGGRVVIMLGAHGREYTYYAVN
jgi:hypothetical protein